MMERLETLAPGTHSVLLERGLPGRHLLVDTDAIRAAGERRVVPLER